MKKSDFDTALSVAIAEEDEALQRQTPEEDHQFSEAHQKQMQSLFRSQRKKRASKRILTRTLLAAAVCTLLVGSAVATSFWDEIRSFIIQQYDGYIEARNVPDMVPYEVSMENIPEEWTEFWWPKYMTEGYEFAEGKELFPSKKLYFSDGTNELILESWKANHGSRFDSEGSGDTVYIDGFAATTLVKEMDGIPQNYIAWSNGETNFELVGVLTFEELVMIAESLVWIESEF